MNISDFGVKLIEAFEGYRAKVYKDAVGVATQGYGHTAAAGGRPLGGSWTREEAREVLRADLNRIYVPAVRKLVKRKLTQGQFDALVSFCFNCGTGALAGSSILRHTNNGDFDQAAGAFALWVKGTVNGRKVTLPGLVRRRAAEALAFQGVQDLNFDGRRDKDEPVYGTPARTVEVAREKIGPEPTLKGAGTAAAGGAVVVLQSAQDALSTAEPHITAGTWIGLALGAVIICGAVYAGYSRWTDMGRPNPFWRNKPETSE